VASLPATAVPSTGLFVWAPPAIFSAVVLRAPNRAAVWARIVAVVALTLVFGELPDPPTVATLSRVVRLGAVLPMLLAAAGSVTVSLFGGPSETDDRIADHETATPSGPGV